MVNDRQWASDALIGGGVGVLSGYILPVALHYGCEPEHRAKLAARSWTIAPWADGERFGAQWVGLF